MNYPRFFYTIPTITLQDELSNFLGTFENGIIEFSYLDIVKSSGHSCPTIAGAYLICLEGLKHLYPDSIPKRGEIKVFFKEDKLDGVTGVIASVLTHITGATENLGFKGINGNFARTNLMSFNDNISSNIKFQRVDNGDIVELQYNPTVIKADPRQMHLMEKIIQNNAKKEEIREFGKLWQNRVKEIFKNIDKVITII